MNHTLTKSEIVDSIQKANRFAFATGKAKETVEILIEIIKRTLASGEDVLVSGFGKFCVQSKRLISWKSFHLLPSVMLTGRCHEYY